MQIDFNPHKIKASKAYIENLINNKKRADEILKKEPKISFFKKILNLLFR